MNIIVKPYGSDICHCRPDTTWERENRDFYSPECVNKILYAPVIFARISKAGKCIGEKFVERYYDGVGCGMLMYCEVSDTQVTSCVDHTSILPSPMYNPTVMDGTQEFAVTKSGESLVALETGECRWKILIQEAICKASKLTSLRIGDYVAVELTELQPLAKKEEGEVVLQGLFCENNIFDFKIIF